MIETNRVFIDTNILVYAYNSDNPAKRKQARKLLRDDLANKELIISVQVLNEYYASLSKEKYHISHKKIVRFILDITKYSTVYALQIKTVESALYLKERYKYSWWDSLILASSLEAECEILYSEDMQNGQVIEETLVIQNPFTGGKHEARRTLSPH
jgi:predicted nucleic acid-binding protein